MGDIIHCMNNAQQPTAMTTRERRERRAERLRGWADGREEKSAAAYEHSSELASVIPFGQPILVGHYSENADRRYRDRIGRAMDQSCEHATKASDMRSRADNIERQNRTAIYSDDVDARERLTAKIAALETQRDEMKTANAAYRKTHAAELKAMSSFERSRAVPFPSYAATNLGANIRRLRDRLAELDRPPVDRTITARFDSECATCGGELRRGDQILYSKQNGARCVVCPTD